MRKTDPQHEELPVCPYCRCNLELVADYPEHAIYTEHYASGNMMIRRSASDYLPNEIYDGPENLPRPKRTQQFKCPQCSRTIFIENIA